jgi:hypothetical protein
MSLVTEAGMHASIRTSALLATLASLTLTAAATGQETARSLLLPTDSALAIVPIRSVEEIDDDLDVVAHVLAAEMNRQERAESARRSSNRFGEVTQNEIKLVEQKLDLAKDEGREAEKLALEAEKKGLEELKRFHERERELRKAEAELAKARIERADAARKALELERELMSQRERSGGMGLASTSQSQVLAEMEERTLKAQKDLFDRDRRVADREKSVIERRLQLFDARKKLFET